MRTIVLCAVSMLVAWGQLLGQQITVPGVKWSDSYSFDRCNNFKVELYVKDNDLRRTLYFKTFYQAGGNNFDVMLNDSNKGGDIETIFDSANHVAIQIFGSDAPEPNITATRFKYPESDEVKTLELVATDETRNIAGHICKKYTYTYKKIFGSVWITTEVDQPNDLGIFRAAKMSALHNSLSAEGFVMEMTSEDSKGGRTVMTTISLGTNESHTVNLIRKKMGTSLNKVNYYTF